MCPGSCTTLKLPLEDEPSPVGGGVCPKSLVPRALSGALWDWNIESMGGAGGLGNRPAAGFTGEKVEAELGRG